MSTVADARAAAGPQLLDPEHPWPGLEAYDERCSEYFSGRTAEADELLRRILDEPLTVLYGKSGLGKTSLLKAGLFPRLRAVDRLPLLVRLQPRAGAPPLIEQVFQALLTQLGNSQLDFKPREGSETLWEFLHRRDQEFWTPKNRLVEPIVVFDQFEELFTLGTVVSDEVASFRGDLADLAENRVPARVAERIAHDEHLESRLDLHRRPCHLVITLREDFLADLESWRPLMPSLRRNRMRLLPMTREQAKSAVVNDHTSHLVPDAIGERILDFLSTSSTSAAESSSSDPIGTVEPALLSLFCRELNERRLQEQKPEFDGDLIEGGKDSIVSEFYENAVKGRPAHVRRFVEEELVTENGYRNSCAEDDAEMQHQVSRADIDALVNLHLLRREHHLGVERVELTHDLLTRAIAEARTARRQQEQADEAKQVLVRQIKRGGLAVACAVLGVFVALGWAAWSARALSGSRELVGFARARLESDAALSMALALEAMKRHDTPEARGVLLEAARYKWPTVAISYDQVGGVPTRVALDRRGDRLAVAAFGEKDRTSVTIWNLEGDQPVQRPNVTCQVQGQASFLAFSPDESYVVVGAADGVRRLDLGPGSCTLLVESPVGSDSPVSFSQDGRVLAWRTEGVASRNAKFIVPEKIAILELGPPQVLTTVEPGYGASFSLVGNDALVWVNISTKPTLLVRSAPGQWTARDLPAPECGHLQAAFPGPRLFTTNWTGGTCLSQIRPQGSAAGSKAVAAESPDVKDARLGYRYMEDAMWSTDGRTVAELLPLRELVLRTFGAGPTIESRLRGEPEIQELPSQIGAMVAISGSGTRVAMLDAGGDHHEIKVFALGAAKPLMTAFPAKAVAVSPDGRWFALASAAVDDTWSVDVRPIDVRTGGVTLRSIPVDAMPAELKALDARQVGIVVGDETRVYDVETGLRADSSKGAVATDGVVRTEDAGCVDPSHQFSVDVDDSTNMTTLFRGNGPGRSMQRHLPGKQCAFDLEGRRLATWSDESGLQFVDTVSGETELVLDIPRVSAVQFLATRSYATVTVSSDPLEGQAAASTFVVPLEPGIIEMFARWLSHRALTPTECDAYALDCSSSPLSGAALLPLPH